MAEKKIELQEIDPVEIFGVNDRFITRLGNYFPKLKIVARGNCISLKGSSKDIAEFSKAIDALIAKDIKSVISALMMWTAFLRSSRKMKNRHSILSEAILR